jgi:hypothetical protein
MGQGPPNFSLERTLHVARKSNRWICEPAQLEGVRSLILVLS